MKLDINRVVFIGRTYEEYKSMFRLQGEEIKQNKILDCPSGACSFTAVSNQQGGDVTACDIVYQIPIGELYNKGLQDVIHTMEHIEVAKDNYIWSYFSSVEDLQKHRLEALETCSRDIKENPSRYVYATLPELPFEDEEFDILLSAHFLFMYSDRFDYAFHVNTVKELLRVVKKEVRIFPCIDLKGDRYEFLDALIEDLQNKGYEVAEVEVPYEFQKGGNTMLQIKKEH
ncbi:methyltransferase domain-containing protein [Bacillus sp. DX4.1]|uniref:methyltransferase domain-containing protein n=1 Tax=Bacillus sp. DX4.1 TaxID=3055867 RepID=UPI0025A048E8|nr:methyltransferase domain-containing protein [Bacillus sp. DX4.1]MDM5187946.1 methyltransferase domain-containing protein [Bacillus sp. DX4.1]